MATNGCGGAGAGDDGESSARPPLHVVMFPWLAFGHFIPFLELAKRLAERGHAVVTFLSTPRNISRLAGAVPPELSARIRLVPLPLPAVDGLPDGADSTADVPPEKVDLLKKAFDGLAAPFAAFLAAACAAGDEEEEAGEFGRKPDWVVVDFAHYWVPPIAGEHEVACASFSILSAAALAFFGTKAANEAHPRRVKPEDFMSPPPWIPFPTTTTLAYRRHEAEWTAAAFSPNSTGVSDADRSWQATDRSDLIVYRSCPDVEGHDLCRLLETLHDKPVVPSGLLLPPPDTTSGDDDDHLIRWLDAQPARSVVYVALGTEAPLTVVNVHELAMGLELSGQRFLWALRAPPRVPAGGDGERLPEGYEQRVAGRGHVATGWVPQVKVLAHASVGAFLTHCGWGSTVESLRFGGHPLVMLPFIVDQGLIARAMADKGLGVEVEREDDGSFGRDAVAAAVRRVMAADEEEGKVFARNAREMKEKLGDGARQERYVDELAELLRRHRRSSS